MHEQNLLRKNIAQLIVISSWKCCQLPSTTTKTKNQL